MLSYPQQIELLNLEERIVNNPALSFQMVALYRKYLLKFT